MYEFNQNSQNENQDNSGNSDNNWNTGNNGNSGNTGNNGNDDNSGNNGNEGNTGNNALSKKEALQAFESNFKVSSKTNNLNQVLMKSNLKHSSISNEVESTTLSVFTKAKFDLYTLNESYAGEDSKEFYSRKFSTVITINTIGTTKQNNTINTAVLPEPSVETFASTIPFIILSRIMMSKLIIRNMIINTKKNLRPPPLLLCLIRIDTITAMSICET